MTMVRDQLAPPEVATFATPANAHRLARTGEALRANGFGVEILDDATAARRRIRELIPQGTVVLTAASETLRISGIEEDINASHRYEPVRTKVHSMDRSAEQSAIRQLMASPDIVIGSASAVTEAGSIVIVSASGSQLPAYAGGARQNILVIGAQKIVPDLQTAFQRIENYALPRESERALRIYGRPSAINKVLILHREPFGPRTLVLLLREPIGF
jgi:L-lactate utilization protein LutB